MQPASCAQFLEHFAYIDYTCICRVYAKELCLDQRIASKGTQTQIDACGYLFILRPSTCMLPLCKCLYPVHVMCTCACRTEISILTLSTHVHLNVCENSCACAYTPENFYLFCIHTSELESAGCWHVLGQHFGPGYNKGVQLLCQSNAWSVCLLF